MLIYIFIYNLGSYYIFVIESALHLILDSLKFFYNWQEVQKFVTLGQKEATNNDGKTPWMVFKETHKELITAGEKWMKGTSKAYTVASTLITTIAFSSAIAFSIVFHLLDGKLTLNGNHIKISKIAFRSFLISDAISFISSVTAILVSLSIATSKYSEQDFLRILPLKLTCGFLTIVISILSMTMGFGSAIYLVFGSWKSIICFSVGAVIVLVGLMVLISPVACKYIKASISPDIFSKRKDAILH